jgi:hypothetical protein
MQDAASITTRPYQELTMVVGATASHATATSRRTVDVQVVVFSSNSSGKGSNNHQKSSEINR